MDKVLAIGILVLSGVFALSGYGELGFMIFFAGAAGGAILKIFDWD